MNFHDITLRLRDDRGQAAVEFALVLPLLIMVLVLIVGCARVFNTYNDVNQMAADGVRFAAVGSFPGEARLLQNADTPQSQLAEVEGPLYLAPGSTVWSPTCVVGGTVKVTVTANVELIPFLPYVDRALPGRPQLQGTAEMRAENCP